MKLPISLKLVLIVFLFWGSETVYAGCEGGFVGASDRNPVMSSVDITFSPVYSSATTSGTSGCPNWNFSQYLDMSREKFVLIKKEALIEETVQGDGQHLHALASLMGCSTSGYPLFTNMMRLHYNRVNYYFQRPNQARRFLNHLKQWVREHPFLSQECKLS